ARKSSSDTRTTPSTSRESASANVVLPAALTPSIATRLLFGSARTRATTSSNEELGMELRPPLRPRGHDPLAAEDLLERLRLRLRVVGLQVELREPQPVALLEQVVDPVAGRVELEPV